MGSVQDGGHAIIHWKNIVLAGLDPEPFNHLFQFRGMFLGKVMALREVLIKIVEFPLIGVVVVSFPVIIDGLPALVPDGETSPHFEILRLFPGRRIGTGGIEGIGHAGSLYGLLGNPAVYIGGFQAQDLQNRRHDVGHVMKLPANLPPFLDLGRPVYDEGIPNTAGVGIGLVASKGRIA